MDNDPYCASSACSHVCGRSLVRVGGRGRTRIGSNRGRSDCRGPQVCPLSLQHPFGPRSRRRAHPRSRSSPLLSGAKTMPITRTSIGWIEPTARVTVRARMDGTIVERHIHDGAEVVAGDLLFRLDDRELQAQIARGRGHPGPRPCRAGQSAGRAQANPGTAGPIRRRPRPKPKRLPPRSGSPPPMSAASEAALAMDRTRLEHTRITAPISGRAGVVHGQ